jgi:formylglycine-generating enzyme required for sulfatase activity
MPRHDPEGYENEILELEEKISELEEKNEWLRRLVRKLGGDPDRLKVSDPSLEEMKEMVEIEPCTFMMGALDDDYDAEDDENPSHAVTLTRKYSIGKYPVTQALWESVMGNNPSHFKGSSRPVEQVNWLDCVLFCNKLSEMEGLEKVYTLPDGLEQELHNQTGNYDENIGKLSKEVSQNLDADGYRLPTEAEWECAGRGGESYLYSGSNNIDKVAWWSESSKSRTHGVGQKQCNGFGLFDMIGNVLEWCWDWWDDESEDYSSAPTEDPTGATTGSDRKLRGGGWNRDAGDSRLSYRIWSNPSYRNSDKGFRLSRTIP